jgi:hypothetical protein
MEDDLKTVKWNISVSTVWIVTYELFWGEIRGKFRGNPECGSAQPSLFMFLFATRRKSSSVIRPVESWEYKQE